jgi:hypothetical protein
MELLMMYAFLDILIYSYEAAFVHPRIKNTLENTVEKM